MPNVFKPTLSQYVTAAYNEYIAKSPAKPIEELKLAKIAKGFFEAKKDHEIVDSSVIDWSKRLAAKKIEYYQNTRTGSFRKFFSALKNLFKFGDFSSTAVIVQKSIKEYEENTGKDQSSNVRNSLSHLYENDSNVNPKEIIDYVKTLISFNGFAALNPTTKILMTMLSIPGLVIESWKIDHKSDIIEVKLKQSIENDKIEINKNLKFSVKKIDNSKVQINFHDDCVKVKTKLLNATLVSMDIKRDEVQCQGKLGFISKRMSFSHDQIEQMFNKAFI